MTNFGILTIEDLGLESLVEQELISQGYQMKECPKCKKTLFYFPQLNGWSHVYLTLDIDQKRCHYNETTAFKEESSK